MNKQKGFSAIFIVLIVAVIVGIGLYIYRMKDPTKEYVWETFPGISRDVTFEEFEEPEGTPEVINNEALDELDALMDEVDSTVIGEDLSDLE